MLGFAFRASKIASTETGVSHSFFISTCPNPLATAIFPNLSPNFPELTFRSVSWHKFITAASIAPVPLELSITTSSVLNRLKRYSLLFLKIASNSGVRW